MMRNKKIQFSTKMDPKIWSQLPKDLLDHVLSFLPLKNFLKMKSTCKHFKSLLFSPSFISKHLSSYSSLCFLLLSHTQFHPVYPLFDTLLNNWRTLSLSPFHIKPSEFRSRFNNKTFNRGINESPGSITKLLSSSNGLVCFSHQDSSSFVICNLLTRSSRIVKFPKLPFQFELLTLVCPSKGGYYKLFMLSCFGPSNKALVFDSKTQSWSEFEGLNLFFSENYNQEGVFFDGLLYFITSEPFVIMGFDLDNGNWKISEFGLPNGLAFARLCSDGKGKLFLIGGLGVSGISRNMKLWELNEEGGWMEIQTVPELMCRKFLSVSYHNYEHVYCFWHQGLICLCCYNWPEILYFKVSRRTWHWVPKCPSLPDKWSCGFRWFSFVPELYAIA
ncbi:hypothetical protein LIER_33598 [Lithospermum erythrorhizon]|uniref:F-box domain-containing protein n=1 Tax=Lithospermum erythrorhizon TaxID=34254 RepID=A0AAV3RZN3_LITER